MTAVCPTCGHETPTVLRAWSTFIAAKVESANSRSVNAGAARWAYAKKRDEWILRWRSAVWICEDPADDSGHVDVKTTSTDCYGRVASSDVIIALERISPVVTSEIWDIKRKRNVTFTRHYAGREREMDHANMVGGMKGAVDAMVRAGLLVDDSPKWFAAEYRQVRSDRSGLHVLIEEVE